jgi:hypothetical protein
MPVVSDARWVKRCELIAEKKKALDNQGLIFIIGGDEGSRTLDTGLSPYAPLAGECLRPLGHVSTRSTADNHRSADETVSEPHHIFSCHSGQ